MSKSRFIFGLCLILLGLSSCRPREVLSRSEMVDVLYDLHLAEALTGGVERQVPAEWTHGMDNYDFRDMAYRAVLKKHEISEETFYASVSYYSKHLRLYSKIYTEVDQRFQDFLTNIDIKKFSVPTVAEVLVNLKMDTLQLKRWFTNAQFKPDTTPLRNVFLPTDSLPTFAAWQTSQWLRKTFKDTLFTVVPIKSISFKKDSLSTDSVVNKVDTIQPSLSSSGTIVEVKREVVAIEGRKPRPQHFRKLEKDEAIRERFKDRRKTN